MKMRLTDRQTPSDLEITPARVGPMPDPVSARPGARLERVGPYKERLGAAIRKYPRFAAIIDTAAAGWTKLVESFCAMIDPTLSRYFPDIRLVVLLTKTGDLELHRIFKGTATRLGALATIGALEKAEIAQTKWTAIELRLPPEHLLQRTLSLPAASRDFLGPIIEHRLERLTPWRPDRVLYGFRTLAEPEPGGGVGVAFTATSRDFVAAPLQALGEAGLVVTAVGAQGHAVVEPLGVNLFRDGAKAARIDSRRMVSRIVLIVFSVLATAYLGSLLWASTEFAEQQHADVTLLKARRLLKAAAMGAVGDRERVLLDAKQPDRAVVVLIDKLANAIPANTFLKDLSITSDKVQLTGISGDAPALVRDLETAGLLNVRFTSAVRREKDQRDSFEITADRAVPAAADPP